VPRAHVNGLDLEYERFGDPTNPPLLLVNGLSYQMIEWDDELCALIADRRFWVTRFDNRDVGLSTKLDVRAGRPRPDGDAGGRRATALHARRHGR
jgi:pimeloyl-ACP methyl ester carboxylesterase